MTETKPNSPTHVGIILDGNRRWAKARGMPTLKGHFKGYQNLRTISRYLMKEKGVKYMSAFVFSTENWSRTEEEVGYLMKLVLRALKDYLKECQEEDIRIVVLGRRDKLSQPILTAIDKAETETKNNQSGVLALCFNYGGQAEIVDAVKNIVDSGVASGSIDEPAFQQYLYHSEVPPIDLLIRTSGEQRLSGFMLWRAAYAELYFTDKHWPDFDKAEADKALAEYANRQRRFGA